MKKILCVLMALAVLSGTASAFAVSSAPAVHAHSCILMRAGGDVLYENNADAKALIASTTKILTAIVVIENSLTTDKVEIKPEWCGVEGSSMYIKAGEIYTVEELLLGMMLLSGNDAAVALACYTAGSCDAFAKLMNEKAQELGMTNSSFKNPNGLDEEGHYSTARDLAVLTGYCMADEKFVSIVSTKNCTINGKTLINHNKLLWNCKGCMGVKTGYTLASGRSLVSCCERDGVRLICVTLGDPDDWNDHMNLYDWAYKNYGMRPVIDSGCRLSLPVVSGEQTAVSISPEREIRLFLPMDAQISYSIELPHFVFAGVSKGDEAGKITALIKGEPVASTKLVYDESVFLKSSAKINSWERLLRLGTLYLRPYYMTG